MCFIGQVVFIFTDDSYMSHLAAGLGLFFPIDVDKHIIHLQDLLQAIIFNIAAKAFGAQYVDDGGRKEYNQDYPVDSPA